MNGSNLEAGAVCGVDHEMRRRQRRRAVVRLEHAHLHSTVGQQSRSHSAVGAVVALAHHHVHHAAIGAAQHPHGMARHGTRVVVLDGDDADLRAARANFGLVWVQGKGPHLPPYQALSRRSADLWPDFAHEMMELTGIEIGRASCRERV